jgi:hypothetical protein
MIIGRRVSVRAFPDGDWLHPGAGKRARAQQSSQSLRRDMAAERRSPFGFG